MGAKITVDCPNQRITITLKLVNRGFNAAELNALTLAFNTAFNGPNAGGFKFKYHNCEVRFALEIRNAPPQARPGESRLEKMGPVAPKGGGATGGPAGQGGVDHTVGISPKPDESFDWATGVDELGHDLGITDPGLGRTWYWRGRGGAGRVNSEHVEELMLNGRDNPAHFAATHTVRSWAYQARCCMPGGAGSVTEVALRRKRRRENGTATV